MAAEVLPRNSACPYRIDLSQVQRHRETEKNCGLFDADSPT
jgi:hypothetical protein